jgi:hypothetical protein
MFERGRVVFYGDGDTDPWRLLTVDIPDQRAVILDVPDGAVTVVVVAPVWVPRRQPRRRWWREPRVILRRLLHGPC